MSYLPVAGAYLAHYMLMALDIALLVRALFSFLAPDSENPLLVLAAFITEPVLALCGAILDKLKISNAGLFDMSFFLAVILVWLFDSLVTLMI